MEYNNKVMLRKSALKDSRTKPESIEPWSNCPLDELIGLRDSLLSLGAQQKYYLDKDSERINLDWGTFTAETRPLWLPRREKERLSKESQIDKEYLFNLGYLAIGELDVLPEIKEWHRQQYPESEGFINTWEPRWVEDFDRCDRYGSYEEWPLNLNYGRKISDPTVIKACAIAAIITALPRKELLLFSEDD